VADTNTVSQLSELYNVHTAQSGNNELKTLNLVANC